MSTNDDASRSASALPRGHVGNAAKQRPQIALDWFVVICFVASAGLSGLIILAAVLG